MSIREQQSAACVWDRERDSSLPYVFAAISIYDRGFLNNPIKSNTVTEMAFAPWGERGSLLGAIWKSGHLLFYHLCYSCVC